MTKTDEKLKKKNEILNENKATVYAKIDSYFSEIMVQLEKRKEQLKEKYWVIESREKRRLRKIAIHYEKNFEVFKGVKGDFELLSRDFDLDMDFLAN